jgi:hypothetical protein
MCFVVSVNLGDFFRAQDCALLFTIALHGGNVASDPSLVDLAVELDQTLNLPLLDSCINVNLLCLLRKLVNRYLGGGLRVGSPAGAFLRGRLFGRNRFRRNGDARCKCNSGNKRL